MMKRPALKMVLSILFVSLLCSVLLAGPGGDKKIYHNEKWDILLLYPNDWTYIEEFGDNVPVILHPPAEDEPDVFVMTYFLGEDVFEDLDALAKDFEEDYLESYEEHKILRISNSNTEEDYPARDYVVTFTDHGEKFESDARLLITEDGASWMILFDRPPGGQDSTAKEAKKIVASVVFKAAEYLSKDE